MAKYRIGQLSKLLGIPTSTIRYYEQCGVLTPKHDPNGYRFYDAVDVHNVMHYEYYRSLDYQPMDARENLYDYTMEEIIQNGTAILNKLQQDLWFDQRRCDIQRKRLEFLSNVKQRLNTIDTVVRPSLYVLAYRLRDEAKTISLLEETNRDKQIAQWMSYMPLVSLTPLIQPSDFLNHIPKEYSALMIKSSDGEKLDITANQYIHRVDQCQCLRFSFYRQKGYMNAFVDYAKPVYDYLDNHGLTINGPITFGHYIAFHKHTTHDFYGEMLIPYAKL